MRAVGKSRDADADASLMKYCTNCVSPSSAPLPGKTSSNGCYYALRQNKNIISASNSSPSHSLTLESFAQVKTCNQFSANHATAQAERRKIISRFKLRNLPRASAEPHQIQLKLIGIRMPENAAK